MTATPPPDPATTPPPGRGPADLLAFLDLAFRAGLLSQPTAAAYRLGSRRILSALPEHACADVTTLNPDRAIAVFAADQGQGLSEMTCRQYAAGFRKALILFANYLAAPERWRAKVAEFAAPGWIPAADGGLDLTIPLPKHHAMRLHLPADVTANDTRLARRLISSYLAEIAPAATGDGEA